MNDIDKLRQQLETILNRNRDARFLRLVLSYVAALERAIHK